MTKWKQPTNPAPMHVVQFIPMDLKNHALVLHRSNNVRSARNVWSFPSGMHDIGCTSRKVIENELSEELGLTLRGFRLFDQYENIAGDENSSEQYHWVISLFFALVDDVTKFENREPDKHDQISILSIEDLGSPSWHKEHPFHPSFSEWCGHEVMNAMRLESQVFIRRHQVLQELV